MVLFFCVTHPPHFSHIGSFEYHKDVCVEHVMQQIEHWNKGMQSDGKLYSHKCVRLPCSFSILSCPHRFGKISTDRSAAGCKLNAHFRRLGFKSSKQPPLQIGAQVVLHNLEVSEPFEWFMKLRFLPGMWVSKCPDLMTKNAILRRPSQNDSCLGRLTVKCERMIPFTCQGCRFHSLCWHLRRMVWKR
jgi:hypothetical protein